MRRSGGIIDTLRTQRRAGGWLILFFHAWLLDRVSFSRLAGGGILPFMAHSCSHAAMGLLGIKLSIRSQLLLFCTEDDLVLLQINSNKVAGIELSDCALDRSSIRDSLSSSEKQVSSFSSFAFGSVSNSLIVVASNESYVRYFMRPSGRCLR